MIFFNYSKIKLKCVLWFYNSPNLGTLTINIIFCIFMFYWCHNFEIPVVYAMEKDVETILEDLGRKVILQSEPKELARELLQFIYSLNLSTYQDILDWKYHVQNHPAVQSFLALQSVAQQYDTQAVYIEGESLIKSIEKQVKAQHFVGDTSFFFKVQQWYFEQLYLSKMQTETTCYGETLNLFTAITDHKQNYHPHVVTQHNIKENFIVYKMNAITTHPLQHSIKMKNIFTHMFASQEISKLVSLGPLDFPYGNNLLKKEILKFANPVSKLFIINEKTINDILNIAENQLNLINKEFPNIEQKLNFLSKDTQRYKKYIVKFLEPHLKLLHMLKITDAFELKDLNIENLEIILENIKIISSHPRQASATIISNLTTIPSINININNDTLNITEIIEKIENTMVSPPLKEFTNNQNFSIPSKHLLLNSKKIAETHVNYAPAIEKCKSLLKKK